MELYRLPGPCEPAQPEPGAFNPRELNFILGSVPVQSIRFCAEQGPAGHDYRYQSPALGEHGVCSDGTRASRGKRRLSLR